MVKSVAMDGTSTLSQAMGSLIDAEQVADSSGDSSSGQLPVVRTARSRAAADAESPAEPAVQVSLSDSPQT